MNRTESLKIVNAFITELGSPAVPPAPPPVVKKDAAVISPKPAGLRPSESSGLGVLMAGCSGFEIGGVSETTPEAPSGFEEGSAANIVPAVPEEVMAPTVATPVVAEAPPEVISARKDVASLANKPLLLSLLQFYSSESQRSNPNRAMLKTTKEQIMKHWPQLVFSPLISALDGAVS